MNPVINSDLTSQNIVNGIATQTEVTGDQIAINFNFQSRDIKRSKGIILLRVAMSGSFSGSKSIKQITIKQQ